MRHADFSNVRAVIHLADWDHQLHISSHLPSLQMKLQLLLVSGHCDLHCHLLGHQSSVPITWPQNSLSVSYCLNSTVSLLHSLSVTGCLTLLSETPSVPSFSNLVAHIPKFAAIRQCRSYVLSFMSSSQTVSCYIRHSSAELLRLLALFCASSVMHLPSGGMIFLEYFNILTWLSIFFLLI